MSFEEKNEILEELTVSQETISRLNDIRERAIIDVQNKKLVSPRGFYYVVASLYVLIGAYFFTDYREVRLESERIYEMVKKLELDKSKTGAVGVYHDEG